MKNLMLLLLFITSVSLYSQLFELDYRSPEKKESQFKISLFRQYMLGVNTLGHLDLSGEVMNINYIGSSGFMGGLSVMGTTSLFYSNNDDKKNNLTHLMNPIGGINGSFYFLFALQVKEKSSLKLSSRLGIKWIQGSALNGFENYFLSGYGMLGSVYQRLLFEDAPENQRIDLKVYPHLMASQVGEENLKIFFDNQLETISYGYGLQMGIEFNRKIRLIFLLNQFINTINSDALGNILLRVTLSYRF